jgi:hypothetical protein
MFNLKTISIMRKICLLFLTIICCTATSFAQLANVYASGLKLGAPSGGNIPVSYFLNTDATELYFNFVQDGAIKASVAITEASLLTKGAHQTTVSLNAAAAGEYNWSMTAKAPAVTVPAKFSDDTQPKFMFYFPVSVKVDNSFESPYLGQIYVVEGIGTVIDTSTDDYFKNGSYRFTMDGIYTFSPALDDLSPDGDNYYGGIEWNAAGSSDGIPYAAFSPGRLDIDDAGKVYIADKSSTNAGVYIMDPAFMDPARAEAPFTPVFDNTGMVTEGTYTGGILAGKHGRVAGIAVSGSGENTVMYTLDENFIPEGYTNRPYIMSGMLYKYNIGNTFPYTGTPTCLFDNPLAGGDSGDPLIGNAAIELVKDGHGGFWFCQYRISDLAAIPSLLHFTSEGVVNYNSGTIGLLGVDYASNRGCLAVSKDGSLLAVGSSGLVKFFDVTYSADGTPTLTAKDSYNITIFTTASYPIRGLSFDVANNIYVTSNYSERLQVYGLPKGENTFTTPAPSAQKITATGTGIAKPTLANVRIADYKNAISILSDGLKIKSYKLYNIAGGVVASGLETANGAMIPTDKLTAGVYQIQIVTGEGTVVKRFIKR